MYDDSIASTSGVLFTVRFPTNNGKLLSNSRTPSANIGQRDTYKGMRVIFQANHNKLFQYQTQNGIRNVQLAVSATEAVSMLPS